jgi:hypothetical protein
MAIEIIERGQRCELNTKAGYSACWIGKNGKPTGGSFTTSEAQAVEQAEKMLALGRAGVHVKKCWFAGFAF